MGRRILTVLSALLVALLGTTLVVVYVGRADARALAGVETVEVIVADGPLKKGQTVKSAQDARLLKKIALPRKTVPASALARLMPSDAKLVFASDVSKGEILQRPRLVRAQDAIDKLTIPAGKLAVTVKLEDPARVSSFVEVGSEIAVFNSYNVFEGSKGKKWTPSGDRLNEEFEYNKATRLLLPRVKVLAIGSEFVPSEPTAKKEADADKKGGLTAAGPADTTLTLVTVAVTQREAEQLIHGTQTGTLYLGLLDKYEVVPGPGVDNRTLFDR